MSYTDHVLSEAEIAVLPASDIIQWHDALDAVHDPKNETTLVDVASHCNVGWPAIQTSAFHAFGDAVE